MMYLLSLIQGPAPPGAHRVQDGEAVRQGAHHPQQERRPGQSKALLKLSVGDLRGEWSAGVVVPLNCRAANG